MSPIEDMVFPAWIVLPMAAVTMIALAGHIAALWAEPMPESRRRIRAANGVLMMMASALLAYVLCVNRDARMFVLVWAGVCLLLLLIVTMAVADMLNTYRLARRARREIRRSVAAAVRSRGAGGARGDMVLQPSAGGAIPDDGAHGERRG